MRHKELKPLELHPRKGRFKLGYIFGIAICSFMLWLILSTFLESKIWLSTFFMWLFGLFCFVTFDSFRASRVKGPIFSFSKHGFIDHRSNPAEIYKWENVESIEWTSHSAKGIGYKLLRIDVSDLSIRQKLGKLFLHHPHEINSLQVILQSPTELGKALRSATPRGKFKT